MKNIHTSGKPIPSKNFYILQVDDGIYNALQLSELQMICEQSSQLLRVLDHQFLGLTVLEGQVASTSDKLAQVGITMLPYSPLTEDTKLQLNEFISFISNFLNISKLDIEKIDKALRENNGSLTGDSMASLFNQALKKAPEEVESGMELDSSALENLDQSNEDESAMVFPTEKSDPMSTAAIAAEEDMEEASEEQLAELTHLLREEAPNVIPLQRKKSSNSPEERLEESVEASFQQLLDQVSDPQIENSSAGFKLTLTKQQVQVSTEDGMFWNIPTHNLDQSDEVKIEITGSQITFGKNKMKKSA